MLPRRISSILSLLVVATLTTTTQAFPNPWPQYRSLASSRPTATTRTVALLASSSSNVNELMPMQPGSTVAMITPFDADTGKVNIHELKTLLQMHIAAGTKNLCILGTTGEANVVTKEERTLILKTAVEECKGQMTILAGTGTIDPAAVKSMTLEAMDLGCDASLVVTPYYVKPPQRYLIQHFITAADEDCPSSLYNVPGRTAVNMNDESIAICAQHENIVALKDATGDLSRLHSLKQILAEQQQQQQQQSTADSNDKFLLYSGDDGSTKDFVLQGGDGCISVTANVAPAEMAALMQACLEQDTVTANTINDKLAALHNDLFCEANPIPTKWALQRMGLIGSDYCRPPLGPLDATTYESQMVQALRLADKLS
eukprot:CAMPEP_0172472330 /NCGR_PEP_ID=MMETSP1065-20121228/68279_1 /TAXON_ID=265537 /ORGANISM="Amphiprora paludosa, Strain CCMP125" /LENGTH=371 /DNA_ID=CAMNT_0013230461 /DNA_START=518 /DNA_END=1629 /DNA_ORIENTATION=+